MAQTLLNFNYTAKEIESAILQALTENGLALDQLTTSVEPSPAEVIQTLEEMDAKLGSACASVQHLFNVFPKQAVIEGYMAAAPKLSEYASKLTKNTWLKNYIHVSLNASLSLEHQKVFKQYQQTMHLAGSYLSNEEQLHLEEYQASLNNACELFEKNIQCSFEKISTDRGEITLDENQFQIMMASEADQKNRYNAYTIHTNRASRNISENKEYDNASLIVEILNARLKIAQLFGYESYWDYSLSTKTLADTQKIKALFEKLLQRCIPKCLSILSAIKELLSLEEDIKPYDLDYCLHQAIEKKYGIRFSEIQAYYPIDAVLNGLIKLSHQLFSIDMKKVNDANTWHPDVIVFEISQNGNSLGLIYADLFIRDHKRSSSWVDIAQARRKLNGGTVQPPIVFLNCNFAPPSIHQPCLLTQHNLVNLLHEFGHALHHLLSESDYATLAGMNGAALDEIEIPSMFFEKFAFEKSFIDLFASHFQTHEPMPPALFEKLKAAYEWIAPIKLIQRLKMALLDCRLHQLTHETNELEVKNIVAEVNQATHIYHEICEYGDWHKSASLIFTSQYAAGYYGYLWSEIVACDFFEILFKNGMIDTHNAELFRNNILAPGGLFNLENASRNICQRAIDTDAFFRQRNIT